MIKTEMDNVVALWGIAFITPSQDTIKESVSVDLEAEAPVASQLAHVQPRIQLQIMEVDEKSRRMNVLATQLFNKDELNHFLVSARAVQQKADDMAALVDSGFDKYREAAKAKAEGAE